MLDLNQNFQGLGIYSDWIVILEIGEWGSYNAAGKITQGSGQWHHKECI